MNQRIGLSTGAAADRRLRLTHIVFDIDGGGMESQVAELARRFNGTVIAMSLITLRGRAGRVGQTMTAVVEHFHVLKPLPLVTMVLPLGLSRCLRSLRPDVVHVHSGCWHKGALAARLAGVPKLVYTQHGRTFDNKWLDRRASKSTDHVVAVSDHVESDLVRLGVDKRKIVKIENGIDVARFRPGSRSSELLSRLSLPTGALIVGSVGRFEPVKNYGMLLRAFARATETVGRGTNAFLVLCGSGSERQLLLSLASELGIAEQVRFVGWVDEAADYYRLFDVFALTSLSEGLSLSLLEAMASGASPVVTAVGSNTDVLGPELGRQSVSLADFDDYVATLVSTLRSSEVRRRISAVARSRVEKRYSLERMVDQYKDLYRS